MLFVVFLISVWHPSEGQRLEALLGDVVLTVIHSSEELNLMVIYAPGILGSVRILDDLLRKA